jgi:hypothetical protein
MKSAFVAVALLLPAVAVAQPATEITTDTLQYCNRLAGEVAQTPSPPPQARDLMAEGQRLCTGGHIRGGIIRLRRAMIVLHDAERVASKPP